MRRKRVVQNQRGRKNSGVPFILGEPRPMFLQDAAIHHHKNTGGTRFLRRSIIDHGLLHPDGWNFELDSLINNLGNGIGTTKYVYHRSEERRVGKDERERRTTK